MKTIEQVKKTKWDFMYRIFITKKFQVLVIAFDFDVPQADYLTVCVITIKLFFIGGWISFDRKYILIPRLSKYKAGGIIGSGYFKKN